jgi:hypothetical protein
MIDFEGQDKNDEVRQANEDTFVEKFRKVGKY